MSLWELLILAVGLSMDAFAVSVCKGLSVKKLKTKHMLTVGAYFGGFQALMPLLGYILGIQFQSMIQQFDHWIAFVLLVLIGLSMIKESREEAENLNDSFSFKTMLPLAVATSIDALAVGVTFAFLQVNIVPAISFIGATTFILSAIGIRIGNRACRRHRADFDGCENFVRASRRTGYDFRLRTGNKKAPRFLLLKAGRCFVLIYELK